MFSILFAACLAGFFYQMFVGNNHEAGIVFLLVAFVCFGYKMYRAALGRE